MTVDFDLVAKSRRKPRQNWAGVERCDLKTTGLTCNEAFELSINKLKWRNRVASQRCELRTNVSVLEIPGSAGKF